MLNDIRLHLDADEENQCRLERNFVNSINDLQLRNVAALQKHIPSIGKIVSQIPFERLSAFVDKHQAINIVDFSAGTTFYGPNVDVTIATQVKSWACSSAVLSFNDKNNHQTTSGIENQVPIMRDTSFSCVQKYAHELQTFCNKQAPDTLVILGLGKALHLDLFFAEMLAYSNHVDSDKFKHSLNINELKYVVIYESDWEVFRTSLSSFDWARFLDALQQYQLQVFLQIGASIESLFDDISELNQMLGASTLVFYKHTNLPAYINVLANIRQGKWGRGVLESSLKELTHLNHHLHVCSAINLDNWQVVQTENQQFKNNMALFKEYFPDIHDAFTNYQPTNWDTVFNEHSRLINLYNRQSNSFYSNSNPKQEGKLLAEHFASYPNVDGLVFGYSGDKLKHYLHNTFIRQADMVLRQSEQKVSELPQQVKAIIVFGLGSAYPLENLYQEHDVQNLIICEPNPDFFFAALHAIDWQIVFDKIKSGEHKLYINIGEASSRLFKDLMSQFLVLGPHLLNETFIFQSYRNPMLDQVLFEVRQQLKVIFSMGENFDHVVYGIAHTAKALADKTPALRYKPAQYLSNTNKQTPIFLIGNGPSLDDSIEIIKEHRDQVIVVSCGTALQALYKNGITPDFHGEVEQNRANFDWASRINDRDYLKKITLISVNGIHPDTYALYKNVLMAFKTGESSTHAILATMPKDSFACLDHSYPTVTNMAMSFFLNLGFEQLYLVGVDLGFADQDKHHSSASGYYENGKQLYDYKAFHAADLRVRGNRQDWVFTKTEFNISRMIIEQLLQDNKQEHNTHRRALAECFNLSNGVFIDGTVPLHPETVLIMTSAQEKQQTMIAMDNCFMSVSSDVCATLAMAYKQELLTSQVNELVQTTNITFACKSDVQTIIDNLGKLLLKAKKQGKSLFFYYFFNSVNYLCAALNKASLQNDQSQALNDCQKILDLWQPFLVDAKQLIANQLNLLDTSEAYSDRREKFLLAKKACVYYFCSNKTLATSVLNFLNASEFHLPLVPLTELSSLNELLFMPTTEGIKTAKVIIDVTLQSELNSIAHLITKGGDDASKPQADIALVFHDYELVSLFRKQHKVLANSICIIYCAPLFVPKAQPQNNNMVSGKQDFLLIHEYCHQLLARAQDMTRFAHILCKPRFCKSGLKNAYIDNNERESQGQMLIAATDNEYESVSVAWIRTNFSPFLALQKTYMFKHYVAVLKADVNIVAPPITVLDGLENRGLLVSRKLFAFELLGAWHENEPHVKQ